MRLEGYWGVGPKTAALLEEELGTEAAVAAIESADSRALVDAGLSRGRATRILRRAQGGDGMDLLATGDARAVYREVVELAEAHAVTERAADRVRVLTPLRSREAVDARLDDVTEAVDSWRALDEATREAVLDAFETHDSRGARSAPDGVSGEAANRIEDGDRSAVETALALRDVGVEAGVFAPLADLDGAVLAEAADALAAVEGDLAAADDRLARLRDQLGAVEDVAADSRAVLEAVGAGARDAGEFGEAFVRHVTAETGLEREAVREAVPAEAADAERFVETALRALAEDRRERVDERASEVRARLEATVEGAAGEIDAAVGAVDDIAFRVSLARFALAYDLTRPELVDRDALAVEGARNLGLVEAGEDVQPVTYAVGAHDLDAPAGDRVAVLTGANSGGKTTLLETLCQVTLLARMGLPVPADRAVVGPVGRVVFHRRHASFNAGVLESTLRSVVPPLTGGGRTLMLVDEFEAITEPGSAADLLHGLVTLTVDRDALGVFVTHLAEDLEPLPEEGRIDGIFAEGLTSDLDLRVDYQPRFGTLGKSTPEFIVSRLVAQAGDRQERAGYEALAEAVGQEAVQRTLADVRWSA